MICHWLREGRLTEVLRRKVSSQTLKPRREHQRCHIVYLHYRRTSSVHQAHDGVHPAVILTSVWSERQMGEHGGVIAQKDSRGGT